MIAAARPPARRHSAGVRAVLSRAQREMPARAGAMVVMRLLGGRSASRSLPGADSTATAPPPRGRISAFAPRLEPRGRAAEYRGVLHDLHHAWEAGIVDAGKVPELLLYGSFLLTFGFIRTSAHM